MKPAIMGIKKGMTQVFLPDGTRVPITIIEAGPMFVLQVKTAEGKDGYDAIQVGFGDKKEKHTTKPMQGHFKKSEAPNLRYIKEFHTDPGETFEVGQQINVDSFEGVKSVDVQGTSKGKGWQGTIKRWHFSRQRMSHGNSISHRMPGGLGRVYSTWHGIPKGKKMAGQMGNKTVTERNLKVYKVDVERKLIMLRGAVPGATGGMVIIRKSIKDVSPDA